jgi:hypothetical protein
MKDKTAQIHELIIKIDNKFCKTVKIITKPICFLFHLTDVQTPKLAIE